MLVIAKLLLLLIMIQCNKSYRNLGNLKNTYYRLLLSSLSTSKSSKSKSTSTSTSSSSSSSSSSSIPTPKTSSNNISEWNNWEYGTFNTKLLKSDSEKDLAIKKFIEEGSQQVITGKLYDTFQSMNNDELDIGINALKQFTLKERLDRFNQVLNQRTDNIRIVYENPSNANNIWASLRTLDTFGIQYADIIAKKEEYKTEWRRDTMTSALGSQKWLTLNQYENTTECIMKLKKNGYKIVCTDLHTESKSIHEFDWKEKIAIVIGNEDKGVSDEVRKLSDERIVIPMKGFSESLNLSVAVAVLCSVLETKGILKGNLKEDEKKRILLTWLVRTVNGAVTVLRCAGIQISNQIWDSFLGFTTKP